MVPVPGATVNTLGREVPDAVIPPRTINPLGAATTASRDSGEPSCHGSTPASIEAGPVDLDVPERWTAVDVAVVDVLDVPPVHETTMMPTTTTTARATTVLKRRRLTTRCRRS
jgi:hypothetical protein